MSDIPAQLSEPMTLMRTKDVKHLADRIEELETKLAKAMEALSEIAKPKTGPDFDWSEEEADRWRAGWYRKYERIARTTLAELKGEDRG